MDFALQHHAEYAFGQIITGAWKPLTPLPEASADEGLTAPPPPSMMLLTLNKRDSSLKMPDKVMTKWHDHAESDFSAVFRKKYQECKQHFPLDLPTSKREAGDEDGAAPNAKRLRTGAKDDADSNVQVKLEESAFTDVGLLQALHWKATIAASPKLSIEVCVGQSVYISNHSAEPHIIKDGTVLAGYFKGKWWSKQQQQKTNVKETGNQPDKEGPADVPFHMTDSTSRCQMNNKVVTLGSIIKTRRELAPADAQVAYHTLTDQPSQSDPTFFVLQPKGYSIFWRCEDLKKVKSEGEDALLIPAAHIAGTIGYKKWQTSDYCELLWAVKWPNVAAKGLQPVRPLIAMCLGLALEFLSFLSTWLGLPL